MKKYFNTLLIGLAALALTSCSDDEKNGPDVSPENNGTQCVYVLSQGNFYKNIEGGLSVLDYSTKTALPNVFKAANNRSLGDTPQCGVAYGSKIYVGTSVSNTIEVLDAVTYKSIKQFQLSQNPENGTSPYSMLAYDGKVFISMYDGYLARLDTLSLTIDKNVKVGPNPDKIALYNGKIYVPVSEGMNGQADYGKTACTVDPATMTIEKKFDVGLNPTQFLSAGNHLFLLCNGNYGDVASKLYEVNDDYTVTEICDATIVASLGRNVAIINQPFTQGEPIVEYKIYEVEKNRLSEWSIERPEYANNMYYDSNSGRFLISSYVMDGMYPSYILPGYVNVYDGETFDKLYSNDLGTAGPTCMFIRQK